MSIPFETDGPWRVYPLKTDLMGPRCPACRYPLPFNEQTWQDYMLKTPHGDRKEKCFACLCRCSAHIVYIREGKHYRYSFECKRCKCWTPELSVTWLCAVCVLSDALSEKDHQRFGDNLDEFTPVNETAWMGKTMDGYLKGIIQGLPGMVVEEPTSDTDG